jgi:leucyl aminopeptidase
MEVKIRVGDLRSVPAEAVVLFHFEQDNTLLAVAGAVNDFTGGMIARVVEAGDFHGEHLEHTLLITQGTLAADRVLLMGLGKRREFTVQRLREAAAQALKALRERRLSNALLPLPQDEQFPVNLEELVDACVFGGMVGLYQFTELRTREREKIREFTLLTLLCREETGALVPRVERAKALARGVNLTRDLVTLPANLATPSYLAERAKEVADRAGMRYHAIGLEEAAELGMGAFLAVAQGSDEPGMVVELDYRPVEIDIDPVVLVGKGITFDSGGISIKPAEHLERMKHDMAGAAALIGTMAVVAALGFPLRVVALIPCTENLPSGKAYKPGDVVRSLSGQTIEVISTDAEGRMVMADALSYAERYKPQAMVDLATLTGACVIALGNGVSGLMGNHDEFIARVQAAADRSGEKVWPLPLWDSYAELLKSDVADVKNVGGRRAGAITAGLFLKRFVPEGVPWVHLDIAGSAWEEKDRPLVPKGATGVGVHLLTHLLEQWKPLSQEKPKT